MASPTPSSALPPTELCSNCGKSLRDSTHALRRRLFSSKMRGLVSNSPTIASALQFIFPFLEFSAMRNGSCGLCHHCSTLVGQAWRGLTDFLKLTADSSWIRNSFPSSYFHNPPELPPKEQQDSRVRKVYYERSTQTMKEILVFHMPKKPNDDVGLDTNIRNLIPQTKNQAMTKTPAQVPNESLPPVRSINPIPQSSSSSQTLKKKVLIIKKVPSKQSQQNFNKEIPVTRTLGTQTVPLLNPVIFVTPVIPPEVIVTPSSNKVVKKKGNNVSTQTLDRTVLSFLSQKSNNTRTYPTPFQKRLRRIVHEEMEELFKNTTFSGTLTKDSMIPANYKIYDECRINCPTVLAFLQGMFCRNISSQLFSSPMRSAVGMAVHEKKKQNCSLFQRFNGLILWQTKASKRTYEAFSDMGFSTSYNVTRRIVKKGIGLENSKMAEQYVLGNIESKEENLLESSDNEDEEIQIRSKRLRISDSNSESSEVSRVVDDIPAAGEAEVSSGIEEDIPVGQAQVSSGPVGEAEVSSGIEDIPVGEAQDSSREIENISSRVIEDIPVEKPQLSSRGIEDIPANAEWSLTESGALCQTLPGITPSEPKATKPAISSTTKAFSGKRNRRKQCLDLV